MFYLRNNRYYYFPGGDTAGYFGRSSDGVRQSVGTVGTGRVQQAGGLIQQDAVPVQMRFGAFAYTDELSDVLPRVLNDLCLDLHHNYQQNPGFAATYREAHVALTEATRLRAAHESDDRETIRQRLLIIDSLLHRLEISVIGWRRSHQKQIGESGLLTKLEISGDIIHHMMYDAGVTPQTHDQNAASAPVPR
ncbi:MAG: hypothetical protein R3C59_19670 [Planctomycetaceae bacterium]